MAKDNDETLATKALLVRVRITVYTARVRDTAASSKLEQDMGAEVGVGIYTKSLVSKKLMNRLGTTVKAIRREYEEITLPWGKDGTRLLPTSQWGEFNDTIEQRREEFWATVDEFLEGYEEHRRNKKRMGKLYNDKEYMPVEKVRERFSFDVNYAPIPQAGDLRLDLSNGELSKLKSELKDQVESEYERASRDILYRIYDAVGTFYNQITGDDWVGVRGKTFDHMQRLAAVLPALNVRNDPKIAGLLKALNDQILVYDAGELRDTQGAPVNPQAKKRATAAAKKIIERIKRVDGTDPTAFVELDDD